MWQRRRTWLVLVALSCVAFAVYFEPTHCVRGWLWGEAFYDGRPTSYWRGELDRWDVELAGYGWMGSVKTFTRTPTWIERWSPGPFRSDSEEELLAKVRARVQGPRILHGNDDNAIPVLRSLLDDPSPKIRLLAQIGLKLDPEVPLRK